jgi:hypothetical protein
MRFRRESAHSEFGFVAEKDPGETFFSQSNKQGFDYYSAYASFKVGKAGNRLYAGDYIVRFGQGLVAWQGFAMGKSSETTQIFRSDEGIRSYSSTDENLFFRGVAARVKVGNALFFPFVSYHRVDAHVDTLAEQTWFGAFQTSGYHRTASEIAGENAIDQFIAGGHASYSYKRWAFGLTSVFNRFNTDLIPDDQPYNLFLPRGKDNFVAGCDWKGSVDKIYFFGEAAVSTNSGKAILTGLMLKPASNAELSLVYRNINTRYFSYFSNAFTESSRINDEQALYFGLKFFPAAHWTVLAYADFFRSKWIKYTTAAPSAGTEMMAQLSFVPTRKTSFYLRFFQEEKDQKEITDLLKYNVNQLINRLRLNYAQILNEKFSMKSRIEFSFYSRESQEMGFLIFQDAVYKSQQRPFSINGRIAYFNTDGYDSRLYAYENDVLYSFSIPPLYGQGFRSYLNFQHSFSSHLSFWLKFAAILQMAQTTGETTINSSVKSEIKLQLRYQF